MSREALEAAKYAKEIARFAAGRSPNSNFFEAGSEAETFNGQNPTGQIFNTGDTVSYAKSTAGVNVNLSNTTSETGGFAQGDVLNSIENIFGSLFADSITGNSDGNQLWGGNGNDTLDGAGGADRILGGAGDDRIIGGEGGDIMSGGWGDDTFIFRGNDMLPGAIEHITDFERGADKIDLSAIDANALLVGNQAFRIVQSNFAQTGNHFSGSAGELVILSTYVSPTVGSSYQTVIGDFSGDGLKDFEIKVSSASNTTLTQSDFIL